MHIPQINLSFCAEVRFNKPIVNDLLNVVQRDMRDNLRREFSLTNTCDS